MAKQGINNLKLGLFVLAGFAFFMVMLYMVGLDTNVFSHNITLKTNFTNAHGLMPGNNVRYAGIQVGTVKTVEMINDTTIEVRMIVDKKMQPFIHKNAIVSMSNDGLMGNKILNIQPKQGHSEIVKNNDELASVNAQDTQEMLDLLFQSNRSIAVITENLKTTIDHINNSSALWTVIGDPSLPGNIKSSVEQIRAAAMSANTSLSELHTLVSGIQQGNGLAGEILSDSATAASFHLFMDALSRTSGSAVEITSGLNQLVEHLQSDLENGPGSAYAILSDTAMVNHMSKSIENLDKGTAAFNENMEALKHSVFFRHYFKKEKQ